MSSHDSLLLNIGPFFVIEYLLEVNTLFSGLGKEHFNHGYEIKKNG